MLASGEHAMLCVLTCRNFFYWEPRTPMPRRMTGTPRIMHARVNRKRSWTAISTGKSGRHQGIPARGWERRCRDGSRGLHNPRTTEKIHLCPYWYCSATSAVYILHSFIYFLKLPGRPTSSRPYQGRIATMTFRSSCKAPPGTPFRERFQHTARIPPNAGQMTFH